MNPQAAKYLFEVNRKKIEQTSVSDTANETALIRKSFNLLALTLVCEQKPAQGQQ